MNWNLIAVGFNGNKTCCDLNKNSQSSCLRTLRIRMGWWSCCYGWRCYCIIGKHEEWGEEIIIINMSYCRRKSSKLTIKQTRIPIGVDGYNGWRFRVNKQKNSYKSLRLQRFKLTETNLTALCNYQWKAYRCSVNQSRPVIEALYVNAKWYVLDVVLDEDANAANDDYVYVCWLWMRLTANATTTATATATTDTLLVLSCYNAANTDSDWDSFCCWFCYFCGSKKEAG